MSRRGGRPRRFGTVALAGWLFADLLLVLALVAMGGESDPNSAVSKPTSTPTRSAPVHTPGPSPSPSQLRTIDKKSVIINVQGADTASLLTQLRNATAPFSGREAALVLTFGGGNAGDTYAHLVNGLLHQARPTLFPATTATRDYLDLGSVPETAKLEIFFYT